MTANGLSIEAHALAALIKPPDYGLSDEFRDVLAHICNQVTKISDLYKLLDRLREYADHRMFCAGEYWRLANVQGLAEGSCPDCTCGYDALLAEIGDY